MTIPQNRKNVKRILIRSFAAAVEKSLRRNNFTGCGYDFILTIIHLKGIFQVLSAHILKGFRGGDFYLPGITVTSCLFYRL